MWTARGGCGLRVPPNKTSVAGVEIARTTDRSRYLRNCARGRRPVDCADGTSASGGEATFARNGTAAFARTPVLPEVDPCTRACRPLEVPKEAIGYDRFTSTPAVHGVGAKRQIYPAMASADFVLSLRQQLVRIDADGASDGDVFRRVMAGIQQEPHASLDAPWLRSIRSEAPARTLSGGQRMRRPENENNVGQANGGDRRHDRHPV